MTKEENNTSVNKEFLIPEENSYKVENEEDNVENKNVPPEKISKEVKHMNNNIIIIITTIVAIILLLVYFAIKDTQKEYNKDIIEEAVADKSYLYDIDKDSIKIEKINTDKDAAWVLTEDIKSIKDGKNKVQSKYYVVLDKGNYRIYVCHKSLMSNAENTEKVTLAKGEANEEECNRLINSDNNYEIRNCIIDLLAKSKVIDTINNNKYPITLDDNVINNWKEEYSWYCNNDNNYIAD